MCILVNNIIGTTLKVNSLVWRYIKEHNLQNPEDKREIMCDEKLERLFGGKKSISMFKMTKEVSDVSNGVFISF